MAGSHPGQRTTLIVTVLDEAETIEALLASIAAQTRAPDEVIVVDGGSQDATWEMLHAWQTAARLPLRIMQVPGANIARGRNVAIQAASGDLVAVTDAGVRLEPNWLGALLSRLGNDTDVVGGFFRPDPRSTLELALGATVLPDLADVDAERFLPSSRSVLFRRAAWEAVGGYPAWLDYGEDLVFDLALKRAGARFAFAPEAIAWFRPRPSLRSFFRQYYLYARGDGKADLWPRRHLIRYATYAAASTVIVVVGRRRPWLPLLLIAGGGLAYTRRPYQRLLPRLGSLSRSRRMLALGLVPVIRLVGDTAKMLGYPVGVSWRLRQPTRAGRHQLWTCRSSS